MCYTTCNHLKERPSGPRPLQASETCPGLLILFCTQTSFNAKQGTDWADTTTLATKIIKYVDFFNT